MSLRHTSLHLPDSPFPTAQQRQKGREAKRGALLLAAAKMFNVRGFHASSLDDVAASVGVTKPTIYHYLGNKEQVLIACMRIGLTALQEAADEANCTHGNGLEKLRTFLMRYAQVNMSEFGQCVIRTGDELLSVEGLKELQSLKRPIDSAMRGFITEGITDGSIASGNVKLMAFALAGALNWPGRWYQADGEMSPQTIAENITDFLTLGFAPRNEQPSPA
jgi:AcrR family transcriptional regulator